MKLINEEENVAAWWLSDEPNKKGIGLKATIDFDAQSIELIEENAKGEQDEAVYMGFGEFRNLQTIIEEKRRSRVAGQGDRPSTPRPKPKPRPLKPGMK